MTGRADLMLAGAVNRSDDLYLHIGFSTLKAVSPTGQSRPFHTDADGLLPSEGAGFVVLKRLEDAEAAGDRILARDPRNRDQQRWPDRGPADAIRSRPGAGYSGALMKSPAWSPRDISLHGVPCDRHAHRRRQRNPQHRACFRRTARTCRSAR